MDIRTISQEKKDRYITKVLETFSDIRNMLNTLEADMQPNILEADMKKQDLIVQANSVWISGQLVNWYYDFMAELKKIEKQKDEIQQQLMDIDQANEYSKELTDNG